MAAIVPYMETNVTWKIAIDHALGCENKDPHKAVAFSVSATRFPTPELARQNLDALMSAAGHYRQIGQSHCGEGVLDSMCLRLDGPTVFMISGISEDLNGRAYDGYRAPSQTDLAQAADAVAAAQ